VAQELAVLTAAHVAAESQLQSLTLQLASAQAKAAAVRTDYDKLQQVHDSSVSSSAAATAQLQARVAQLQAELVSLTVISLFLCAMLQVCAEVARASGRKHSFSVAVRHTSL
jgi:multidrug resistance efflux pump